jgi:YVTN family beta-propeller protein
MNKSLNRCTWFLALALLATPLTLRADLANHAEDDAFAAEAQALAPLVLGPEDPPPPGDNSTLGVWSGVIPWTPHIPVSAAQLPDGRLLTFSSNQRTTFPAGVEFTYAATWDPATGAFVEYNHPTHDMFCGGIIMLPDGRVMVNGGRNETVRASVFDWRTNQWTRIQNMNGGRWYNTSVALPDGQVFTATGSGTGLNTTERWNSATGWNILTGVSWAPIMTEDGYVKNWHPFLSLTPDGRLFHFGPTDIMHWITTSGSGTITNIGNVPGSHYPKEGCFAVYEDGKFLVAGGAPNTVANVEGTTHGASIPWTYLVNVNTTPPTVTVGNDMANSRQFANSVILPNGEVMVIGGNTTGVKFADTGSVFPCEIWNPTTGLWRTVGSISVPRNYHSLALLLPDGRVLSGGGGLSGNSADHRDAQLYTPPMLYNADGSLATRPAITTIPSQIGVGAVFNVTGTPGMTKFAFIKMSAITHSMNTDLRYLSLPFTENSAGNYSLTARSNLNVMTPGYWMLFGVLPSGAYSVAKIVQVDATGAVSLANPGNQSSVVNAVASLQMVSNGPAGVTRTYSATGLPPGLTISAATGLISGSGTTVGTYNVRVTVTGGPSTSFQDFTWTISPATIVQNFTTFPNATGFTVNGNATVTANVLRLTTNVNSQAGTIFLTSPISTGENTSFTTRFVFRQHGTTDGADGLAFVVQGVAANALGTGGSGLGYGGIGRSLAVEIDAFQGTGDPSGNHLGILTNGDVATHLQSHTPAFDLENGSSHTIWVEYDGPANILRVYLAQGVVVTRPASPVMTANNLDLAALIGGPAWYGFAGGTGGAADNHDIEAWSLTVNANALPAPPVVTNPGARTSVVGTAASLQVQATDANGDLLTYSATGLPTGLSIGASNGLIAGTPTAAGVFNPVVTVNDGSSTPVNVAFTWTVNNALTVQPLTGAPVISGTTVSFTGQAVGGLNPEYKWNFGDGTPDTAFSSSPGATHPYLTPGRYLITLTVRDGTGAEITTSFYQAIHAILTALKPTQSSSIVFEDRATGNDRIWCVNPDNNSVSVFDAVTRARLAEVNVGVAPRTLAVAPDGRVWVVNAGASSLTILNSSTFAVASTVTLPRAARPFGLAFDPDGTDAWVACEESGQLLRLNPANGAQVASIAVGANVRHVSVSADSSRVFVSRFVSPPLPGEGTATVQTEVAGVKRGGEVVVVNATLGAIDRTIVLQHSEEPDTIVSAKGIPNYVGGVAISPDGQSAWVPSKQDNIKRGTLRNGQPLTHDMALRSVVSRLVLNPGVPTTDDLANRVDFDNAGIPSAATFDSRGMYLFTALEGSRTVSVTDSWSKTELLRFDAGRAPQGLALSPDSRTLYVHNFMDRTVTVHNVGPIIDGTETPPIIAATLNCVTTDLLSATVLKGKQFFYDARDERVALQEYISCASCHNDGGQDGRVWDFTQFGEGLRNTIVLRGHGGTAQGPLHWSGNFDEVQDFEGQIRNFAGGLGLMSDTDFHSGTRDQPLGDTKAGRSADLDALAAYVASLTQSGSSPARNSDGSLTTAAVTGETVFRQQNCASCHTGTRFTDSALGVFRNVGTIKPASGQRLGAPLTGLDTPTLRGLWNTAPYLHDGSAATVSDAVAAHTGVNLNATDLANLTAYLRQIDDAVTTAPLDTTAPTIILTGPASPVSSVFNVTATFSEAVTGLVAADFVVTNGSATNLSGGGSVYTLAVTPTAAGSVTVNLPINRCTDLSGNNNAVSNTFSVTYTPNVTIVNGLSGDYYAGDNFESYAFTRVDPAINFSWPWETLAPGYPADHFSIRWTGQILPQITGTYTFFTSADDGVRLWVNGQLLVDNWENQGVTERQGTIALTAGVPADIRLEFFDSEWGASVKLEWQTTGLTRQVIPTARLSAGNNRPVPALSTTSTAVSGPFTVAVAFGEAVTGLAASDFDIANGTATNLTGSGAAYVLTVTPGAPGAVVVNLPANGCIDTDGQGNVASNTLTTTYTPPAGAVVQGLTGDYYSGRNFERLVLTRVDQTVNFSWPFDGPTAAMPRDLFSIRWTGKVIPLHTQAYTFFTTTDDGVRLWVNNQLLVDQWVDQGSTTHQGIIALTAGVPVEIRMEYFDNSWGAVAKLEWQSSSQVRQVIPKEQLSAGSGRPVPALSTSNPSVTGAFSVAVNFGESVSGLTANDFLVANGTPASLNGSGAAYTLTVNPAANGEVTVNLPANVCLDITNEGNVAANTLSVTYTPLPGALLSGLTGEYYSGKHFESLVLTRIDETVNFNWLIDSPAQSVPANSFSVRWTGKVTPQYSQTYTFITSTDDGVRLWVNNQLLVDQWQDQGTTSYQGTIALTAGVPVDIRMEYYDSEWGAVAILEWQSASQTRQVIPRDRLTTPAPAAPPPAANFAAARLLVSPANSTDAPATSTASSSTMTTTSTSRTVSRASVRSGVAVTGSGMTIPSSTGPERGLRGEYFSGEHFDTLITTQTDDEVAFYWPEGVAPLPGVSLDRYSVRWSGRIRPNYSEDYTFFLVSDEGVRLWLNDELIVDRWTPAAQSDFEVPGLPIFLRAGQFYDLRIEFQNVAHDGWVELKWESDSQPREIVPATRLFQPLESSLQAP